MSARRILTGAGVVALVGAISLALPALRGLAGLGSSDVPVFEVRRGAFVRQVSAEGNLQAVEATVLGPPAEISQPLRIAWLAPDGSAVEAGDVVIRFDPTEKEEELRQGRHDLAATDSRITQKDVRKESTRRGMERDADMAALELEYAGQFQSKDSAIFSRNEIIESEIDQELARKRKDHAAASSDIHEGLAQAELDLLSIERRKAEQKIEVAEKVLRALEVRAPHEGILVLKRIWGDKPQVGQMVWGGHAVAELPRLDKMEARVHVLEADAGGLEVGQKASLVIDARPGTAYGARVAAVDALAQPRNNEVPVQYFGVTLELEATDSQVMKPGQRVTAALTLDELSSVVTVPRQAVFDGEQGKVVYRRNGTGFDPVRVELGPSALGQVVVEQGLAPGDWIALRDPTRPTDVPDEPEQDGGAGPVGAGS